LIAHRIERNKEAKPQTVKNDVIWLKTAIKTMRSVNGFTFDRAVFDDAYETLRREKLIAKSIEREQRPTRKELWRCHAFNTVILMGYSILVQTLPIGFARLQLLEIRTISQLIYPL